MNYNLLVFSFTVIVISLIPGLNVMLIVSQSIHGGMKNSAISVLGIVASNLIYFSISLLGLGVILMKFPGVFQVVKFSGVAFTLYSAWNLLKLGLSKSDVQAAVLKDESGGQYFIQGMLTVLSNPKSFIFWVTVLPGFVDPNEHIFTQVAIFGIVAIALDTLILLAYGYLGSAAGPYIQKKSQHTQFLISGIILVVVAIWLLLT